MLNCPGCDNSEQRSLNDLFQQAIIDAQKFANKEKVKVAVVQEGRSYSFIKIGSSIPAGTRHIVEPVQ